METERSNEGKGREDERGRKETEREKEGRGRKGKGGKRVGGRRRSAHWWAW